MEPQSPPIPTKPDTAPEKEARQLMKRLRRLRGNWPSEPTLTNLRPQTVDALIKIADRDVRNPAWILLFSVMALGLFSALTIAGLLLRREPLMFLGGYLMLADTLLTPVIYASVVGVRNQQRKYAVYALTQTNDVRVLNTLIQPTVTRWGRHAEVIRAITRLLAQVSEWHAGLLTPFAQYHLWNLAVKPATTSPHFDAHFASEALRVLACVGNGTMLMQMKELASQHGGGALRNDLVVAAQQHVPYMEDRFKRQSVPATLLRAADMPTSQPETLLRAALPTSAEPTAQLLRASTSEYPETDV